MKAPDFQTQVMGLTMPELTLAVLQSSDLSFDRKKPRFEVIKRPVQDHRANNTMAKLIQGMLETTIKQFTRINNSNINIH